MGIVSERIEKAAAVRVIATRGQDEELEKAANERAGLVKRAVAAAKAANGGKVLPADMRAILKDPQGWLDANGKKGDAEDAADGGDDEATEKSKLSQKERDALPASDFAIPKTRDYPIQDKGHAVAALGLASGKPEESEVRAAVYKRYPELKK